MFAKASTRAAAAALCASAFLATPSLAKGASYTIDIQGFVPVICRAQVQATAVPAAAGEASLGKLTEFCNDAHGYRVYADYSPALAAADLVVDGRIVHLSHAGSTMISQSQYAAIASHDVSLRLPQGVSGGSISFR